MKVTRLINGHEVELVYDKIKEYPKHNLYQVSKVVNGTKIPVRKESFTQRQLYQLAKDGYIFKSEW